MRKILITAAVVSMVSMAMANKLEVGIDGGYGFGFGTALVGPNITWDPVGTMIKYEQVYASGGQGIKIGGQISYFLTENVGIMVASGYSMQGEYTTELLDQSIGGSHITVKGTTSYLPITMGLKFRAKIGNRLVPYIYMAPGVFFPQKTEDTTSTAGTITKTYTYAMGLGVSAGIGVAVTLPLLSDRVGIKVEFAPTYAFANPTGYTDPSGTYTYKNNAPQLAPGEVADQPHDSFCSLDVRGGLVIRIF